MAIDLWMATLVTKKELVAKLNRLNGDGYPTVARIIPQSSILEVGEIAVNYSVDGNGTEVLVMKEK